MKKCLLSIIIFMVLPVIVLAEDKIELSLNNVDVTNEKEIEVNLTIKNNPGFGYLGLEVEFDQEKLEYVSSEIIGMKNSLMKGADINKNGNLSVYALQISDKKLINDNGKILTIKFKLKDDFYTTLINLTNVSIGKDENNPFEYDIKSSEVTKQLKENISKNSSKSLEKDVEKYIKEEDIAYEDIEWSSSNDKVAKVDKDGNIKFNNNGKTTITGKIDDKVVFEKTYTVKNNFNYFILLIPLIIVLIIIIILYIIKKRKMSNKNKKTLQSK